MSKKWGKKVNIFNESKKRHLSFKEENSKDNNFLYSLYTSTREVELSMTNLSEVEKKKFLKSQFELKERDYKSKFENGNFLIIYKKKNPIGRVVFNIDKTLHIVDIALIKKERSKGYGNLIFKDFFNYAKELQKYTTLSVAKDNFLAMKLYQRLGFIVTNQEGFYYQMIRKNDE